jgi:hypothetical protein
MPPAPQVLTLSPLTIRGKVQGGQTMVALVSLWYNVMVTSTFTPPPIALVIGSGAVVVVTGVYNRPCILCQ